MGLIVSLDEKKNFVGIVSGNKKHIHDIFLFCIFRAVEAVKVGK